MITATHRAGGMVLTDHLFDLPLDHADPGDRRRLEVFAREVVAPSRHDQDLPWLVFFQGGPGGKSPRPLQRDGWVRRACEDYRVLLLDQRGTGRSTPATRQTLATLGSPKAQAEYLTHFRADAIVSDAEHIRRQLVGPERPWSVLGQSFGGFCVLRYLSAAPEGLREALITGGIPSLWANADAVYRATYPRVLAKNAEYAARYPEDEGLATRIAEHLDTHDVRLPDGDRLTARRFQTLGIGFGMSDGYERLHYLLEEAFVTGPAGPDLSETFLHEVGQQVSFATKPLYALVHEAAYCQEEASQWAADRVRAEFPEFDLERGGPVRFTGEMIYPWHFQEDAALRPLEEAAHLLADYEQWPRLYDPERLSANGVPVAAAVYADDMYVDRALSEATAASVPGIRTWVTNEYEHNGLRADGGRVLGRLIGMARGEV